MKHPYSINMHTDRCKCSDVRMAKVQCCSSWQRFRPSLLLDNFPNLNWSWALATHMTIKPAQHKKTNTEDHLTSQPWVFSISCFRFLCSHVPPSVSSSESYSYFGLSSLPPPACAAACCAIMRMYICWICKFSITTADWVEAWSCRLQYWRPSALKIPHTRKLL